MSDFPLAYHITWHTYGTWLPGDQRGWVDRREPAIQAGSAALRQHAEKLLVQPPVFLTVEQRRVVGRVIREHCRIRGWQLHALNVLRTHTHAVISALVHGEVVRSQIKAWTCRRLNEHRGTKQEWWAGEGDIETIGDETYLQNAKRYVVEKQEEAPLDDDDADDKPHEPGAQATG